MLATDPRRPTAWVSPMKCPDGSYELVSGNEMGALLLDYICAGRIEKGTMPKNPVAVKSIVSTRWPMPSPPTTAWRCAAC